jgi:alkaline phosphatase
MHLVALLQFIEGVACKKDTLVVVTSHDTTSILATIEHRWKLDPLSDRDKAVADLSSLWKARQVSSK